MSELNILFSNSLMILAWKKVISLSSFFKSSFNLSKSLILKIFSFKFLSVELILETSKILIYSIAPLAALYKSLLSLGKFFL